MRHVQRERDDKNMKVCQFWGMCIHVIDLEV